MATFIRWYQKKLVQQPMATQSLTSFFLFGLGDVVAQSALEAKPWHTYDLERTPRTALYGGVIFGPLATKWFNFLQRRVCFPKRPALEVGARVFADQVLITPCSIALFLSTMSILQGMNPRDRLESTWWPALCKNWMVWPLVQAVNFALVPLQYRVLVVNVVALAWNSYLSWISNTQQSTTPI